MLGISHGSNLKAQGWAGLLLMIREVGTPFHLGKLINDLHFRTLALGSCDAPEQGSIAFRCSNAQQVIWIKKETPIRHV
ncbi:glycoside hydrolase family 95 protein [Sphaerobolus stellatus SS14]|nr:glycoside hydrolase family 95 protein [Sphaerobolus stellatus SS14]